MRILTLENNAFDMTVLPEEIDDLRFSVLDNSDPKNPDFFFIPLIFLESFNSSALVLRIGGKQIQMPLDWHILIGEAEMGDLEVIPLTSINDRGFNAFSFNSLTSFRPEFLPIEIEDIFQDVKWYFPKLRPGQLLAVPIDTSKEPRCVYFVSDISRQSEVVDYGKIW